MLTQVGGVTQRLADRLTHRQLQACRRTVWSFCEQVTLVIFQASAVDTL